MAARREGEVTASNARENIAAGPSYPSSARKKMTQRATSTMGLRAPSRHRRAACVARSLYTCARCAHGSAHRHIKRQRIDDVTRRDVTRCPSMAAASAS